MATETIKKQDFKLLTLPNILTSMNLSCGVVATILSFVDLKYMAIASLLILIAAVFDFLDGMTARLLKAYSPIGKDLDSLADMVSFGVAPAVMVFLLMLKSTNTNINDLFVNTNFFYSTLLLAIPLLLPVFSALRLAKFNIDTRQSDSFIGLPTPANAMLLASFPVILYFHTDNQWLTEIILNPYFLGVICLIESFLLISEIPMFSLKFKNLSFKKNKQRFAFLILSLFLIIAFKIIAIPVVILLFVTMSIFSNIFKHENI